MPQLRVLSCKDSETLQVKVQWLLNEILYPVPKPARKKEVIDWLEIYFKSVKHASHVILTG